MDLTSGAPFWIVRDGLPAVYPKLKQNRRCDVAIIGGGITGALVAHRFAHEGIHVILLERREIEVYQSHGRNRPSPPTTPPWPLQATRKM